MDPPISTFILIGVHSIITLLTIPIQMTSGLMYRPVWEVCYCQMCINHQLERGVELRTPTYALGTVGVVDHSRRSMFVHSQVVVVVEVVVMIDNK